MTPKPDDKQPDAVFMTFIAASAQATWDLLTDRAKSPQFFFGNLMSVGPGVGKPFTLTRGDGTPDVEGEVLAYEPPRRLRISWKLVQAPQLPVAEFEFLIEPVDDAVRLTLSQFNGGPVDPKFMRSGLEGWSLVLSGLKTLLETGKALPPVKPRPPQ
jgi:uncharacterized protein YndB with AHSA1/START domain